MRSLSTHPLLSVYIWHFFCTFVHTLLTVPLKALLMIFIEPPEHYLQKKLQMLWLVAYLTGVPPVGLHALRCFCRGQAPDGSKVLLPEQLSSLELEQLLGSPLNLTVNPFFAGDRHQCGPRFNALTGLSCYVSCMQTIWRTGCFNALMGLSCYIQSTAWIC